MKKIFLLIVFVSYSFFAKAQVPAFQWAKNIGGWMVDVGKCVDVDTFGNVYTVGSFDGTVDLDPGVGVFNLTSNSGSNFILKLDSVGDFVWAKQLNCTVDAIEIDAFGYIYLAGSFRYTVDFDLNAGIYNVTPVGLRDNFILKLNLAGNFVWVKNVGGTGGNLDIKCKGDGMGNVYASGMFYGTTDFDPGVGTFNLTSVAGGNGDVFVFKLDSLGDFLWAKSVGGNSTEECRSIALDNSNNVFITGMFYGVVDFDPGVGTSFLSATGGYDSYILKLDPNGNFLWARRMGGNAICESYSIEVDLLGNAYTVGRFSGTCDVNPDAGVFNFSSIDGVDMFILKLNTLGNFIWAKQIEGDGVTNGFSSKLDVNRNLYITGDFTNTADFDPGAGVYNLISSSQQDIFISKFDSTGNFIWATKTGSLIDDKSLSIAIDVSGNVYTTGYFYGTVDFNFGAGVNNLASSSHNIFILKMGPLGMGIDENRNEEITSVYPNPTNGLFTIELRTKAQVSITNTLGEVVLNQTLEARKQMINLQNQANGIYFVKVLSEGKQTLSKLIKQ